MHPLRSCRFIGHVAFLCVRSSLLLLVPRIPAKSGMAFQVSIPRGGAGLPGYPMPSPTKSQPSRRSPQKLAPLGDFEKMLTPMPIDVTQQFSKKSLRSSMSLPTLQPTGGRRQMRSLASLAELHNASAQRDREEDSSFVAMRNLSTWFQKQDIVRASAPRRRRPLWTPSTNRGISAAADQFFAAGATVPGILREQKDALPAPPPPPALPPIANPKKGKSGVAEMASSALNARYGDMFKAFQFIDQDRSGFIGAKELARALDLWNIPIDRETVFKLVQECDKDGNGEISYNEFVDALARDTVAGAAMGKRGMQAKEAMGVEALDSEFLGHKHMKNVKASINDFNFDDL